MSKSESILCILVGALGLGIAFRAFARHKLLYYSGDLEGWGSPWAAVIPGVVFLSWGLVGLFRRKNPSG
jgi:hypothetical protein